MHSNKISVIGDVISIDYPSKYSELLCEKKKFNEFRYCYPSLIKCNYTYWFFSVVDWKCPTQVLLDLNAL